MSLAVFGPEAVLQRNGVPARGVPVQIVERGTQTPVALYSDSGGVTPVANPITTDEYGNLFFYSAPGDYDILVNSGRIPIVVTAAGSGGGTYTHVQTIPNSVWTIIHNLGFKPNVTVEVGGEVVLADISHSSNTTALVNFALPCMGSAYLS